jgi:predicted NACHT family NTPase
MILREIRDSVFFQELCQRVLAAEYEDFQSIDDSGGDKGNDGYVPSLKRLFAIYCPEKDRTPKTEYIRKIKSDLKKAIVLRDRYQYEITEWIFVTPSSLPEEVHTFITKQAKTEGVIGISWSESKLLEILTRHPNVKTLYPELLVPDLQTDIRDGFEALNSKIDLIDSKISGQKGLDSIPRIEYKGIDPYLSRKVFEAKDANSIERMFLNDDLLDDFFVIIRQQKRIVLLANAGGGKTTELKQLAAYYSRDGLSFYPFLILLNKYVNQTIPELLPSYWKQIPEQELLIILDGLDEIESKNKNDAIRQIESFSEQYPNAHIVISCRTNFYRVGAEYSSGNLEGFTPYILLDLGEKEIQEYVMNRLGKREKDFNRIILENHIYSLLKIPFYLINLVDLFSANNDLPRSKSEIFEQLLNSRIQHDVKKYRTTIANIDEKRKPIIQTLERLALAMETLGRNYISEDEFDEIVPSESLRHLVKHCTTWRRVEGPVITWQFEHNNFQEFLAAKALSRQKLEVIKNFISFRPSYEKIIPFWMNALSFLVSILEKDAVRFADIFNWIKETEPELVIKFEPDKINSDTRHVIFKDIFDEYKQKQIAIDRTKFDLAELARFAQSDKTVDFLLTEAEGAERNKNHGILFSAVELLGHSSIPTNQRRRTEELLIRLAIDSQVGEYIQGRVLIILANLSLHTQENINKILPLLRLSTKDDVRHGLYYLLYNGDHLDENIDVFLEGIKLSNNYDVENHLIRGLEKASSEHSVKAIITYLMNHTDDLNNHYSSSSEAIAVIAENAACYPQNQDIFASATGLFIALVVTSLKDEAKAMIKYFDKTRTRLRAFQAVLSQRKSITYALQILAVLSDLECIRFFAQQFVEKQVSANDVWSFQNYLGYRNHDLYLPFNTLINEVSGNQFVLPPNPDTKVEKRQQLQRDIDLLFNKQGFLEEVEKIFSISKKNSFNQQGLIDITIEHWNSPYFSSLVLHTLRNIANQKGESITLEKAVNIINGWDWDLFTIRRLCKYFESDSDIELSQVQKDLVAKWCYSHLSEVDFRKALVQEADGTTTSNSAIFLWYFLRKLDLEYPEEVLLDMLSFDWVEKNRMVGINYIEERVSQAKIEARVLENLSKGIKFNDVMSNHISYCQRNRVSLAIPFILCELTNNKRPYGIRELALNTVIELSNDPAALEEALPKITDSFKWSIIKELMKHNSQIGYAYLKSTLERSRETDGVIAADYLIKLQDIAGLEYYVGWIEEHKRFNVRDTRRSPLQTLREADSIPFLIESIPLLIRLLKISYQKDLIQDHLDTLNMALQDTLSKIAMRSDECYQQVREAVESFIETNSSTIDSVKLLYYYLNRLEQTYLYSKSEKLSIAEVLYKIDQVIQP